MDKETALHKSEHYCAYQERSKQEVVNKLHEWEVSSQELDEIIQQLEETKFLNQERFAKAYAQGKFRMKNWHLDTDGLIISGYNNPCFMMALMVQWVE